MWKMIIISTSSYTMLPSTTPFSSFQLQCLVHWGISWTNNHVHSTCNAHPSTPGTPQPASNPSVPFQCKWKQDVTKKQVRDMGKWVSCVVREGHCYHSCTSIFCSAEAQNGLWKVTHEAHKDFVPNEMAQAAAWFTVIVLIIFYQLLHTHAHSPKQ